MRRGPVTSRLTIGLAAGALLLAACGSGSGDDSGGAAEAADGQEAVAAVPVAASGVDLGSTEVDPAAEVPTNLFPDLVVDDVVRAKKVNLRNLIPSEKPVLLWMWAPH